LNVTSLKDTKLKALPSRLKRMASPTGLKDASYPSGKQPSSYGMRMRKMRKPPSKMINYMKTYRITQALAQASDRGLVAYTSYSPEDAKKDYLTALILLQEAKVFELDEEITKLLTLTKNKVRPTRLPFPVVFIETELELPDIWIKTIEGIRKTTVKYLGFLLVESVPITTRDGVTVQIDFRGEWKHNYPNIYIYSVTEDEAGIGHLKISFYKDYDPLKEQREREYKLWRKERNQIRNFIMNFLDFLHDPEVQYVEISRSQKSRMKRIRKGLVPLPPSSIVTVKGTLKRYLEQLRTGRSFTYSHRFWVRGHWRHFHHPRFKNMRGKRIWIPPYVKGSGILIDKRYRLVK